LIKTIKISVGLILATFWSCTSPTIPLTKQPTNQFSDNKQDSSLYSGISLVDGKYKIDTAIILTNQNLQPLLDSLNKSDLVKKNKVAEIPGFVKTFLKKLSGSFTIADSGEDWQATDCVMNTKLKDRQLIYFGLGNNIALMAYYTGGIGVSEHILIIKFRDTTINDFWCVDILRDVTNRKEILNFLQEYKDNPGGITSSNRIFL
jgi:hypothetical protein